MKKALIFDLDGTLLNTLEDLCSSVNAALETFGLPSRSLEEIRRFVGNGAEKLINRSVAGRLSPQEEQQCLEVFRRHYQLHMNDKTCPYEGILSLIRELKERDYLLAIVSNKFHEAVKELNISYFDGMFPVTIGASKDIAVKPAPDGVKEALRQLGVTKEDALYIGDSDVDALTAKNADLPFIGVTWGFRDEEQLLSMGAQYIIHRPEELWAVLNRRDFV